MQLVRILLSIIDSEVDMAFPIIPEYFLSNRFND